MKFHKLLIIAAAVCLLVGASQAMAKKDKDVNAGLVVGVDSASGDVSVDGEDVCMKAVFDLISEGFELQSVYPLGGSEGPELTAYLFTKFGRQSDVATLYCIADIDIDVGGRN